MKVKYTAGTQVCVSVVLDSGQSVHVSFSPITGGKSVFYTEDERLQKALESHHRFGKLFKKEELKEKKEAVVPMSVTESPKAKKEKEVKEVKEIAVSDLGVAREYLVSKFGVSRTKVRTRGQIENMAKANNIAFVGI